MFRIPLSSDPSGLQILHFTQRYTANKPDLTSKSHLDYFFRIGTSFTLGQMTRTHTTLLNQFQYILNIYLVKVKRTKSLVFQVV